MARERVHSSRHAARRSLAIALKRLRAACEAVCGGLLHDHGLLLAEQIDAAQPFRPRRIARLLLARAHERAPAEEVVHARETLSYAAEALGSAEALYELARVDDLLGWGAFVRTREEKERKPPWTTWLRRIDLLGEKKAVFMQPAFTNDLAYRAEALKGYRAAAARGVSAAVDALARHATHENDKDVRRSGKAPSAPPAPPSPAAKPEAK